MELLLPAEDLPEAGDLLGKVSQVCSGLNTRNDLLELPPEVHNSDQSSPEPGHLLYP